MEKVVGGLGILAILAVFGTLFARNLFGDGFNEEKLTESLQSKYTDAHLIHSISLTEHVVIKEDGTVIIAVTPNTWDADIEREELIGKVEISE